MSFCDLAVSGVAQLQPYVPGKPIEELQRQYGVRNVIKLASNENPLGPPKAAVAAVAMAAKEMARYPDGNGYALKLALADKHQVAPEQITLGNGSNDVLEMVARAFAGPGDEVVFSNTLLLCMPSSLKLLVQRQSWLRRKTMVMIWMLFIKRLARVQKSFLLQTQITRPVPG